MRESRDATTPLERLFFAVFPPAPVREAAVRAAATLRARGDGVAWVRADKMHFTLRFMGAGLDSEVPGLVAAMREVASVERAFDVALGGFGAFPAARRARVLWIGLAEGDARLRALAGGLNAVLVREGFGRPDQSFEPHLTVGRIRAGGDWADRLAAAPAPAARFRVDRILLVRSTLNPAGGSVYEPLAEAVLPG